MLNLTDRNKPMSRAFNVAVLHIANRLFPTGFDVGPEAPANLDELVEHIERTGRMLVWDGASDQTIFADQEVNFAFRAWHDWAHWHYRLPFDHVGEATAFVIQKSHIRELYGDGAFLRDVAGPLLRAEVLGQLEYKEQHGDFPADQWAFVAEQLAQ